MSMQITRHYTTRSIERNEEINRRNDAVRVAKVAYASGKTIKDFARCPKFSEYLRSKRDQTANGTIRVYKRNIYIWRGKKNILVTTYPIPECFMEEIKDYI